MKRWIDFTINHPRIVLLIIIVITAVAAIGFKDLYYDSSTEALVPEDDITYIMSQRSKKVFGDTNTLMLSVIGPARGAELFSYPVFMHLDGLVSEIEEYQVFHRVREDQRLRALVELSGVSVDAGKALEQGKAASAAMDCAEADLDASIFDGAESLSAGQAPQDDGDIWDLSVPVGTDYYARPLRNRSRYGYDTYRPATLRDIKNVLDEPGRRQLDTIMYLHDLAVKDDDHMGADTFRLILETWEDMYLYKSMEVVKTFMNPLSGEDIIGRDDVLQPVRLVPLDSRGKRRIPRSADEYAEYTKTLLKNPAFESVLYARGEDDAIQALAMSIEMRPLKDYSTAFDYLYAIIEKNNTAPVRITSVGGPVYKKYIRDYMERDLQKFMPLIIIVIILTFYFNFRVLRGVLLPVITVLVGTFWTLGIMGFAGVPITIVVNMLPPLLVAVGSSYSIHIFNQYLNDQQYIHSTGKQKGLSRAMSHISTTVLLAGVTTFFAFLTLSTNQVSSLRDFGIFAAIGTILAVAVSVMLIPGVLVMLRLMPNHDASLMRLGVNRANFLVRRIITGSSWLALRHPALTVTATGLLVVICSYGIVQLRTETSPMYYFSEDSYIYKSDLLVGEMFRGSLVTGIVFDSGKPGGVKDPSFLSFVEDARGWITAPENSSRFHMLHTASLGDVIKRMHKAMNGDRDEFYRIPRDRATIMDYFEIYSGTDSDSDGRVDNLESFVDAGFRYATLLVRIGPVEGVPFSMSVIEQGHREINRYLEEHPGSGGITWHFVGEPVIFTALSKYIIWGQVQSILYTLVIIAFVVLLLFRNFRAALVSLIPIATSIVIVYGLMGFFGIPLDIPKAILAAVALGIGVDDTVHMLKTIRHHQKKGMPLRETMTETYREAGLAIVYTSVALVFGFSVFLFSNFAPIFNFGWLLTSTMVATTFAALVLLPAVIVLFNINLAREQGGAFFAMLKKLVPFRGGEADDEREDMIA